MSWTTRALATSRPRPTAQRVPALGLGTWTMGERAAARRAKSPRCKRGLDLGMTLIDTAEMYGDGGAEEIVCARDRRPPRRGLSSSARSIRRTRVRCRRHSIAACERSLAPPRDRSHRSLSAALARTHSARGDRRCIRAPAARRARSVRWGVSNFDIDGHGGVACASRRTLAVQSTRYCTTWPNAESNGACSRGAARTAFRSWPIRRSRKATWLANRKLAAIARDVRSRHRHCSRWHGCSTRPDVIAIPKSSNAAHVDEIRAAAAIAPRRPRSRGPRCGVSAAAKGNAACP